MQVTELWVHLQDKENMSPFEAQDKIRKTIPQADFFELQLFISSFKYIDDAYRWLKIANNKKGA